jgi:hypothetical protein
LIEEGNHFFRSFNRSQSMIIEGIWQTTNRHVRISNRLYHLYAVRPKKILRSFNALLINLLRQISSGINVGFKKFRKIVVS